MRIVTNESSFIENENSKFSRQNTMESNISIDNDKQFFVFVYHSIRIRLNHWPYTFYTNGKKDSIKMPKIYHFFLFQNCLLSNFNLLKKWNKNKLARDPDLIFQSIISLKKII